MARDWKQTACRSEFDAQFCGWGISYMSEVEPETVSNNERTNGQGQSVDISASGTRLKYGLPSADLSLRLFRDEAEIQAISCALKQTGWNRKRAAQLLSISYRGLLYKIRRHNISPPPSAASTSK
jgi:transcriptional regulator with GAF, ATPase, and Fis domain